MRFLLVCAAGAAVAVPCPAAEPTLLVEVSQPFASAAADRPVNSTQCVSEERNGVRVRGTAEAVGRVSVEFAPCDDRAVILLVLDGTVTTRTVGTRGPVRVCNAAAIPFRACKPVTADADRLCWGPAGGSASAALELLGVATRLKSAALDAALRRVATRAYYRQEADAARDIGRDTGRRIAREFDQEAEPELEKAARSYQTDLLGRLRDKGLLPDDRRLATTADQLLLRAFLPGPAAPGGSAPPIAGRPDLAVRVHQSLLTNGGQTLFAGKTLTDEQLDRELRSLVPPRPNAEAKPKDPDAKPFSITFAPDRPLEAAFAGGTAAVTLRTRGFTDGDDVYTEPYDVLIPYKLEQQDGAPTLVRERLRVRNPEDRPLAGRAQTVATVLRRRLEKELPERIKLDDIALPDELAKVGRLHATQAASDGGWLTLAWDRAPAR